MKMKKKNITKTVKIITIIILSTIFIFVIKFLLMSLNVIIEIIKIPKEVFIIKTLFMGILFLYIIHLLIKLLDDVFKWIFEELGELKKLK